ncbi:heparin cofactor 2 [Pelodytes ibericus]
MNLLYFATFILLISSVSCGVKDMVEHFEMGDKKIDPRASLSILQEDTVTNDLISDDEDEDYLDLEKILEENEYDIDIIDEVLNIKVPEVGKLNLYELFQGKTRVQRLSIINANFGFNLYRAIKDTTNTSENILLAPVGISTAIATLSLGAKDDTLGQILSVVGFKDFINASSKYEIATIHNVFRKLTHRLFRRNFGFTLRSVNDLYIKKDFSIGEDFKNNMKNYYFAEAQSADFSDKSFLTKANQRIHKLTKGLVKEALVNVDPSLLLLLVNCIYFKGTWENKFPVENTHNTNFRLNEKEVVKVPMMKTKGSFLVASDRELECEVLQLPYVGNISMLIVLPHKLSGMKTLEKQLNPSVVEKWQKSMINRTREVLIPRFKLDKNYNLKDILSTMGLKDVFTHADFSGISNEEINIGLFQHQGTITVNEEGTQAAAVTTVGFTPLSTQTRFIADRPFLFFIYEYRTNCLVFMGRVSNPLLS